MDTVERVSHLLLQAGTAWILWLLAALSLASVIVFIERLITYRAVSIELEPLSRALAEELEAGHRRAAIERLRRAGAVAPRIAAAGLELASRGARAAENAMRSATALERMRLERRLSFLATLGNNAPFVGLLGTVIGVIEAFEALGHGAPEGAGEPVGAVASQAVMAAVAEALVATAVGILVALPAIAAYNILQRRVATLLESGEVLSRLVLAYVGAREDAGPGREEPRDG
ncbi:MAG: MotA/TolQ/ExbB proton channel family protein [Myxococcales bacterium]|nr:MotA/TolQ/ExbB proton channel family protein [Myxococcales bacterium]